MSSGRILVVDDDPNILELLKIRLEAGDYEVCTAEDEDEAKRASQAQPLDLAIIDLQLARESGITVMEDIHRTLPDLPVIILTAHGSIESAVDAMQRGAFTYITKPFDPRELGLQIERAMEKRRLTAEVTRLKELLQDNYGFESIVARSDKMQQILKQISHIAKTDSSVYIAGESGTGKELVARAIHLVSPRRDNSFVAINCGAIPESLLESELFGYEKGAFTGAVKSSKGLFMQAHNGTIFLDEIGDMPFPLQVKFLRVLQERQFYHLGGGRPVEVDFRVIVATNKDLQEEVKNGRFREDLFYRINVIPVVLPPLRERKEDIPPLVDHFLKKFSEQMDKKVKGLTPKAMQKLLLYDWPGNVRELINTMEYAVAMTQTDLITEDFILKTQTDVEPLRPLKQARELFEKEYLAELMKLSQGNVSRAATMAGRYRADLYHLLKKYRIKPADFKTDRDQ